MNTTTLTTIVKYINAIRNPAKRDYARRYAIWMFRAENSTAPEPARFTLSVMGAQAVRMRLSELTNKEQ